MFQASTHTHTLGRFNILTVVFFIQSAQSFQHTRQLSILVHPQNPTKKKCLSAPEWKARSNGLMPPRAMDSSRPTRTAALAPTNSSRTKPPFKWTASGPWTRVHRLRLLLNKAQKVCKQPISDPTLTGLRTRPFRKKWCPSQWDKLCWLKSSFFSWSGFALSSSNLWYGVNAGRVKLPSVQPPHAMVHIFYQRKAGVGLRRLIFELNQRRVLTQKLNMKCGQSSH